MKATKACTKCGKEKPLEEFHRNPATRDRRQVQCKVCACALSRQYRAERKEHYANYLLQYRFGITLAEYNAMLEAQSGSCAICGRTPDEEGKRLCVDHDHETGEVRGLLCNECNAGLGRFHDDPARLRSAANYVE